jgi:hypothetical protein
LQINIWAVYRIIKGEKMSQINKQKRIVSMVLWSLGTILFLAACIIAIITMLTNDMPIPTQTNILCAGLAFGGVVILLISLMTHYLGK